MIYTPKILNNFFWENDILLHIFSVCIDEDRYLFFLLNKDIFYLFLEKYRSIDSRMAETDHELS